jgi:protein-S-isoprenylcysteine O-methyltransferase Ste14
MWLSYLWLSLGWILYGVIHSALASAACKRWFVQRSIFIARHYRILYILVASISLALMAVLFWETPRFLLWKPIPIVQITGIFLIIGGSFIMGIIIKKYFSTVKNMHDLMYDNAIPILFQEGLHSIIRHPLYLGTFLLIWGLFLLVPFGSLFVTNAIITLYTLIGIGYEEKKLMRVFGEKYVRYKEEVPMLLPKLRKNWLT